MWMAWWSKMASLLRCDGGVRWRCCCGVDGVVERWWNGNGWRFKIKTDKRKTAIWDHSPFESHLFPLDKRSELTITNTYRHIYTDGPVWCFVNFSKPQQYIWSIVTKLRLLGSGGHLHQIKAIIISFCGLTENMLRDPWENLGTLTPKIEIFTTHLNYVWWLLETMSMHLINHTKKQLLLCNI